MHSSQLHVNNMQCRKNRILLVLGRDPFNQNSNRSDREKWTTSKGGPVFSKLFRLDRTDPLSFGPKFPEILVEWIAPLVSEKTQKARNKQNMYSYKRCSQYSRDPTGIATPKPSITSRAIFTVTTLSLLHKSAFPCGLDIGMLCGQSDYPNPSLGSHGVSGIQTFFQLVGRFYQNTQPAAK